MFRCSKVVFIFVCYVSVYGKKDESNELPEVRLYKEGQVISKGNLPIPDEVDGDPTQIGQAIDYYFGHMPNCDRAPLDKAGELFNSEAYFPKVGSIIILHDKCGSASDEYVAAILEALKQRGIWNNYNIFTLNYPNLMCAVEDKIADIIGLKTKLHDASLQLTSFFENGLKTGKIKLDQINLIGLGLGAQLAGEVARTLKDGDKKIKSIVGLNPTEVQSVQQVSKGDAQVVQLLHTYSPKYGTESRVGTADFVFNGAKTLQPLCMKKSNSEECSHRRSFKIFTAVIAFTSRFQAWHCLTWEDFALEECPDTSTNYGYVFYPPDESMKGVYYLRVGRTWPYGLGEDGRKFDDKTINDEVVPGYKPKINKRQHISR